MTKYQVEKYPADGHSGPHDNDRLATCGTIEDARRAVREHLGVRKLMPARRWYPDRESGAVEAYHDYPESHPRAYGCGGVVIIETSDLPSAPAGALPLNPTR